MKQTTFSGKIKEWPTFWNIFEDTIYNHKEVSTINKLRYLINVKKPASAHIGNMEKKSKKLQNSNINLGEELQSTNSSLRQPFSKPLDIPNNTQQEAKSIRKVATKIRQTIGQLKKMPNKHTHR
jgi:Protein of unknown function (DUF1759)